MVKHVKQQNKSPRNENLNLLVRIKFLNLFLHSSLKKKLKNLLVRTKFYCLGPADRCSSGGLEQHIFMQISVIKI